MVTRVTLYCNKALLYCMLPNSDTEVGHAVTPKCIGSALDKDTYTNKTYFCILSYLKSLESLLRVKLTFFFAILHIQ